MLEEDRPRLPRRGSEQPGQLRVGASGFEVSLSAAIFSDINIANFGLSKNEYTEEKEDTLQTYLGHAK